MEFVVLIGRETVFLRNIEPTADLLVDLLVSRIELLLCENEERGEMVKMIS